jgi:hypothetical protein
VWLVRAVAGAGRVWRAAFVYSDSGDLNSRTSNHIITKIPSKTTTKIGTTDPQRPNSRRNV